MVHTIRLNGAKAAGRVAVVDDHRAELVSAYSWHVIESRPGLCYVVAYVRGSGGGRHRRTIKLHTLISGLKAPDHANGDPFDNTDGNLRKATDSQNSANRKRRRESRWPYKGIAQVPSGRWQARVNRRYLGTFDTAESAARAYDVAALEAWGEFAWLNFPSP